MMKKKWACLLITHHTATLSPERTYVWTNNIVRLILIVDVTYLIIVPFEPSVKSGFGTVRCSHLRRINQPFFFIALEPPMNTYVRIRM